MNEIPRTWIDQVSAGFVVVVPPALTAWYWSANGLPDIISTILLAVMYLLTGYGVTIGFHRYFSHKSFRVNHEWVRYTLAILGSMALVGLLAEWIMTHDPRHHGFADKDGDPHSPHRYGDGFFAKARGFAYAHIGWFFVEPKYELSEEVQADPLVRKIDRFLPLSATCGLLLPACIGVLLRGSFDCFIADLMWGGIARMCLVHHSTWSVNSVGHLWGSRPFVTNDRSVDNRFVAGVALGEGNQCTHHAFPRSACHALLPGQRDPSWPVICLLEKVGLITDVIVPTADEIEAMRA